MDTISNILSENPIIISLTNEDDFPRALQSNSKIVILIQSDICTIKNVVTQFKKKDKLVFVHIDLIKGIKRDASGVKFLANHIGIDGIVTTYASLIKIAKMLNLFAIQRFFILDRASITYGLKLIKDVQPDAVEILPGIAYPYLKEKLQFDRSQVIIAAGLINSEDEITTILQNGAHGISSSSVNLWNFAS